MGVKHPDAQSIHLKNKNQHLHPGAHRSRYKPGTRVLINETTHETIPRITITQYRRNIFFIQGQNILFFLFKSILLTLIFVVMIIKNNLIMFTIYMFTNYLY